MADLSHRPITLALFCKVVDNFGDIGICYRLARQLTLEHQVEVTLWVDDLASFQRICPEVDPGQSQQLVQQIRVIHWNDQDVDCTSEQVADIVIEFFGCELPAAYIAAMKIRRPVWINLEGLCAEDWVESCHTLPSPQFTLTKYFYYPGFTAKTGGLLLESGLLQERDHYRQNPAQAREFLNGLGLSPEEQAAQKVSLFCYPHAPVTELFRAWQNSPTPITCLVPQGVAPQQVQAFTGNQTRAGVRVTHGALTVRVIPFLPQPDYDRLLWLCNVNFVRGEDSFVRAQWAGRPFVWHIYPQDKNLHHVKLNAFLQRSGFAETSQNGLSLAWNEAGPITPDFAALWQDFVTGRQKIANMALEWQSKLLTNGDLAANLMQFAASVAQKPA